MTDDKILENLYKLQGLKSPESDKFIQKWIDDTKFDIAKSSVENVGLGDTLKTLRKIVKKGPLLSTHPLGGLHTPNFVVDSGSTMQLLLASDYGLPVLANRTDYANAIRENILTARATKGEAVVLPTRAELTSMLRWAKASKERMDYSPTGGAHYYLQNLIDMLALFPNGTARMVEGGILYFEYAPLKGILLPSRR